MSTKGGRKVLAARRLKGRKNYQHKTKGRIKFMWSFLLSKAIQWKENLDKSWRKEWIHEIFGKPEKNRDFQLVYKQGTSFANRFLVMYVKKNQLGRNRIGISVSKKVGNSVVRHHLARLIRESYRLHEEEFQCGMDVVVIARVNAKTVRISR